MGLIEDGKLIIKYIAKPDKPIKWKDNDNLQDEMSNDVFLKNVAEVEKKRDIKKYGRDGIQTIWERNFTYRKLPFLIRVNRYFVIGVPMTEMRGMNHIGKWAVLEYPDEMKKIVDFVEGDLEKSDFLFQDTLHLWNDNMNLKQMVNSMIDAGKRDIDWWLDKAEEEMKQNHISSLQRFNQVWGVKNVLRKA